MFTLPRLGAALLFAAGIQAAEMPPAADPDLPQPFEFDSKALSDMRAHSPFNRFVSLEDTIQLTGVAYIDGKPMATLVNTQTKQRFVVSEEPNALGWTLTGARVSDEPSKTEVHVMIGEEEVVMHYGEMQLSPGNAKGGKLDASSSSKKHSSSHSHSSGAGDSVDLASMLGDKGKQLLKELSPENREKLAAIMASSMEKHPERSKEEIAATAQKIFAKMQSSETKAQSGSAKVPKLDKPKKR